MYTGFVKRSILTAICLITLQILSLQAQNLDFSEISAEREFRWGVQAFHSGRFNRAILSFERSLSLKPDDTRTRLWLGNAYYRSGFEESALTMWESLIQNGYEDPLLQYKIDIIQRRRGLGQELDIQEDFYLSHTIEGKYPEYNLFLRPSSISSAGSGGFYLASFGSNEIVRFNANGYREQKLRGGVEGINHPFDILRVGESLYISEFEGDRIIKFSLDGRETSSFGERGRGPGQLLGPQYLTVDEKGFLYITESGNRRISKFDTDGNFVLSFGRPAPGFSGLSSPTGIFACNGRIYVSDIRNPGISVFDYSGNYLETHSDPILDFPEGIDLFREGVLLIACGDHLVTFDISREVFQEIPHIEGSRLTKAIIDDNNNLISVDFNTSSVKVYSEMSQLYGGLWVQINKVFAEDFPRVEVELTVRDRSGEPFIGLDKSNFILTERGMAVKDPDLTWSADEASIASIAILLDRSLEMRNYEEEAWKAVKELLAGIQGRGGVQLISAGEDPVVSAPAGSQPILFQSAVHKDDYSTRWSFDRGLRLAVSSLLETNGTKEVIFVTDGKLPPGSFERYGLLESMQFLRNNGISFSFITVKGGSDNSVGSVDNSYDSYDSYNSFSHELTYLSDETGGQGYYLFHPEGVGVVIDAILSRKTGVYNLTFISSLDSDFGKRYLPLEIEVFLYKRSGRAEGGYYTLLEL